MNKLINILFLLIGYLSSNAQDCLVNLEEANQAYYNGRFEEVNVLLQDCINGSLTATDNATVLRLLINANIIANHQELADQYMNQLLALDPNYVLKSNELPEFKKLYDNYQINTKYAYGFTLGINKPDFLILQHQSYASETVEPLDYQESLGFVLGVTGDYALSTQFYLSTSLLLQSASFEQQEIILNYQKVRSKEREIVASIPIQLKYVFDKWKFKPFASIGISFHIPISSKADLDHSPIPPERIIGRNLGTTFQTSDYDLSNQRINLRRNILASVGFQYKIKDLLLEAKVNYERGLKNLVRSENRFADDTLLNVFAYVPDDFKQDNYYFTFSALKTISKIKKK